MFEFKVYEFATGLQLTSMQAVNAEFYIALIVGAIAGLTFWSVLKGAF